MTAEKNEYRIKNKAYMKTLINIWSPYFARFSFIKTVFQSISFDGLVNH